MYKHSQPFVWEKSGCRRPWRAPAPIVKEADARFASQITLTYGKACELACALTIYTNAGA